MGSLKLSDCSLPPTRLLQLPWVWGCSFGPTLPVFPTPPSFSPPHLLESPGDLPLEGPALGDSGVGGWRRPASPVQIRLWPGCSAGLARQVPMGEGCCRVPPPADRLSSLPVLRQALRQKHQEAQQACRPHNLPVLQAAQQRELEVRGAQAGWPASCPVGTTWLG